MEEVNESVSELTTDDASPADRLNDALFGEDEENEIEDEIDTDEPEGEPDEEPDEGESEDGEPAGSVEVDGQVIELPEGTPPEVAEAISEAISAKEKAMQADYTRKAQEVGEMRKNAEQMAQEVQLQTQFAERYVERMTQFNAVQAQLQQLDTLDWDSFFEQHEILTNSDPIAAMHLHNKMLRLQQQRAELHKTYETLQQEHAQDYAKAQEQAQQQRAESYRNCVETLQKHIPSYDREVDQRLVQTAIRLGEQYGIKVDATQLSNDLNPLTWLGLYELSKAMDARTSAKTKIERDKPRQFVKPGVKVSKSTETERRHREHLRKTGKGAASLIEKFL